MRAGTPATMARGGTFLVTTEPAADDGAISDGDSLENGAE